MIGMTRYDIIATIKGLVIQDLSGIGIEAKQSPKKKPKTVKVKEIARYATTTIFRFGGGENLLNLDRINQVSKPVREASLVGFSIT